MDQQVGSGSLCFAKAPFIIGTASVVGTKEGEGPLADAFDCIGPDDKFGQQTWEAAESSLQKEALTLALGKADQKPEDMRYLFAGDLLGQLIASSFGLKTFEIPLFGLYGACSTCGEALALSAMTVAAGYADRVAAVTSSHFASVYQCRLCRMCDGTDFQSFCQCGKTVPFSAGIRKSASGKCHMDSDRRRCIYSVKGCEAAAGKGGGSHNRKDCRLRNQGFHEYGSRDGTGCR